MADLQLQAVLDFFRRNGLSTCESALMTDVQSLLLPQLRIPAIAGRSSNDASSDDEFLSAGSFATDFNSPYGNHPTQPSSQGSSDQLSQFGTARANPDFDMHNDLFWYEEEEDDDDDDEDFDRNPSEDKFMMSVQARESAMDYDYLKNLTSEDRTKCVEGRLALELRENFKDESCNGCYDDKNFEHCNGYNCLSCLCRSFCNAKNYGTEDLKMTNVLGATKSQKLDEKINLETIQDLNELEKDDEYEAFNLRIIHRKNRTGFEENKELPFVLNCVIAGRYYVTEFIGSAAFSRVFQAHDLCSGMDVCLKIIKNDKDFFDQSLAEIKLLKLVNKHDPFDERHILRLFDYFYHKEHLFIVTELLRANLYEFQKYSQECGGEPYFTLPKLQIIAQQCLEALFYLHGLGIIHCDLKPENILIKSYRRCEIKVIDLGSSCFQTDTLSFYVQSRSYRAPEVILGLPFDQKIDLWSLGCIFAELYSGHVLFPNEAVVMILARVIALLGPIDTCMLLKGEETHKYFTKEYDLYYIHEDTNELEYIVPDEMSLEDHPEISDPLFVDFLKYLLEIYPKRRPTAREALEHPWLSHSFGE